MKNLILALLAIVSVTFIACDDDDDGFQFDPELMHFDGVNANAPILPVGQVELASQFGQDAMDFYAGKRIDAVQVFIFQVPASARLMFYGNGPGDTPGSILYQQDLTGALQANSWNIIELDTPVEFPTDELWIGIQLPEGGGVQVIGCDAGPRVDGGDWMYQLPDQSWLTFNERSGDNINWNIRAMITD